MSKKQHDLTYRIHLIILEFCCAVGFGFIYSYSILGGL